GGGDVDAGRRPSGGPRVRGSRRASGSGGGRGPAGAGRPCRCTSSAGGVTDAVEFLDVDDLIDLARRLLGDPPPIRDVGLLGSAAARPQMSVAGEDAYPDLWLKAAALLQSVVKNHALVDGNKRLGWMATAV